MQLVVGNHTMINSKTPDNKMEIICKTEEYLVGKHKAHFASRVLGTHCWITKMFFTKLPNPEGNKLLGHPCPCPPFMPLNLLPEQSWQNGGLGQDHGEFRSACCPPVHSKKGWMAFSRFTRLKSTGIPIIQLKTIRVHSKRTWMCGGKGSSHSFFKWWPHSNSSGGSERN